MPTLYPRILLTVGERQKPDRLDAYIAGNHKNYTRSRIKALCQENLLLVNGLPAKASYQVKPHDSIAILSPYATQEDPLAPENIPVKVLYEDEHIIVVDKVAGMAVHPGLGDYKNTLVNALNFYINKDSNTSEQIKVAHRLDKHTSGALVFARSQNALEGLINQFTEHSIERTYYAVVAGVPEVRSGNLRNFMGRHPANEKLICISGDQSFGKEAITHYKVIETFGNQASMVECQLETGRTHQIRIHMQHLGHSLIHDKRYPDQKNLVSPEVLKECFEIMPYQALHAHILGFKHPVSNALLRFESAFPEPFQKLTRFLTFLER